MKKKMTATSTAAFMKMACNGVSRGMRPSQRYRDPIKHRYAVLNRANRMVRNVKRVMETNAKEMKTLEAMKQKEMLAKIKEDGQYLAALRRGIRSMKKRLGLES